MYFGVSSSITENLDKILGHGGKELGYEFSTGNVFGGQTWFHNGKPGEKEMKVTCYVDRMHRFIRFTVAGRTHE